MKTLERAGQMLVSVIRAIDWALIAVVAGFLAVVPARAILGVVRPPTRAAAPSPSGDPSHIAYKSSIAAAAVKTPAYAVELGTVRGATINVANLGPGAPPLTDRDFDMWVAPASQLRAACAGAADPLRRLQQVLGLPPIAQPGRVVTEMEVPRDALFRPCVAGGDVGSPKCAEEFPALLAVGADAKVVRAEYDRLHFVAAQMWNSYRDGFPTTGRSATDYPSSGFPFTGMGWTYDWSDVPNHVGVTEFVIRREATVKVIGTPQTPAQFCAATGK
jgi:hypothetical protein